VPSASALPTIEQLAERTSELARQNEALEDFATLVAHELKTPLHAALLADDGASFVEQALRLVDSLLEAARCERRARRVSSPSACLDDAVQDVGAAGVEVSAELAATFPLPADPLRLILRNLLRNAIGARAQRIHVTADCIDGTWQLSVDDDGVGLGDRDLYTHGSGLGFGLCRRLAERFGGELELTPRPCGGTRARLVLEELRT
jgi:signal transduction histidine kinase